MLKPSMLQCSTKKSILQHIKQLICARRNMFQHDLIVTTAPHCKPLPSNYSWSSEPQLCFWEQKNRMTFHGLKLLELNHSIVLSFFLQISNKGFYETQREFQGRVSDTYSGRYIRTGKRKLSDIQNYGFIFLNSSLEAGNRDYSLTSSSKHRPGISVSEFAVPLS